MSSPRAARYCQQFVGFFGGEDHVFRRLQGGPSDSTERMASLENTVGP